MIKLSSPLNIAHVHDLDARVLMVYHDNLAHLL